MKKLYICLIIVLCSMKGFAQFSEYGGTYYDYQSGQTGVVITYNSPPPNWAAINAAQDAQWAAAQAAANANIPKPPVIPPPPQPQPPITVGSSQQATSKPYVALPNDKLAKPNIPTTIIKQVLNTCVSSGMEYLAQIYGKTVDRKTFEDYYHKQFGVFLILYGVDYSKMTAFANNFFETTAFVGVTQAIDAGNFMMTNLDVGNNVYHNVVIVGYHPNGDYIYLDPFYGNLRESPPANFPKNYVVTIKNYK
ncbi:hypothetical protein [Flavobacterium salmonis]|uniref:Peptidase C39-like domain-containing protein n=1 Tax=Flavobacterium salmonis TaxID=2654844 RepID=A0A6V6YRY2_9FLAO|nr:hypothetical protein [Flavobacterium salmonis]CAD0002241.1 hypothetical protein FLAT13_01000 [Flavobacterium salmonis]